MEILSRAKFDSAASVATFSGLIALNYGWSAFASAREAQSAQAAFDGFTESGSTADMTVPSRTLQNVEERGDLTLTRTLRGDFGQSSISLYGGALGLQRTGDATLNAILLGQSLAFATPGRSSITGAYVGGGADWRCGALP